MYLARLVHLLLVALGFIAIAQASSPDHARRQQRDVQRRQNDETVSPTEADPSPSPTPTPTATPTEDDEDTTTATDPTTEDDDTDDPTPTTTQDQDSPTATPDEPSPTPTPTDDGDDDDDDDDQAPSPTPDSPTPEPTPTTTTDEANDGGGDTTTTDEGGDATPTPTATDNGGDQTQTTAEEVVSTITQIVTSTNEAGEATSFTSEYATTSTAALSADDDDDSGGGGMDTNTRNIVIGVVCGVGGAIVLGALGFVAWRLWGRKKRQENDNLMDYNTAGTSAFNSEPKNDATSGSTGGPSRSPFQTTLENYHQPGQVNASSNF